MNWEAISAIGQLVGALAVVISLIYLARQVRSNARETRRAAMRSTLDSLNRFTQQITEHADLAELRDRGFDDFESLEGSDGAVWYSDVPNKRCVRVREGGDVLQTVDADRGCFACMLGGAHRKTLFIVATEWRGMDAIPEVARARTGKVMAIETPAPHAGWP